MKRCFSLLVILAALLLSSCVQEDKKNFEIAQRSGDVFFGRIIYVQPGDHDKTPGKQSFWAGVFDHDGWNIDDIELCFEDGGMWHDKICTGAATVNADIKRVKSRPDFSVFSAVSQTKMLRLISVEISGKSNSYTFTFDQPVVLTAKPGQHLNYVGDLMFSLSGDVHENKPRLEIKTVDRMQETSNDFLHSAGVQSREMFYPNLLDLTGATYDVYHKEKEIEYDITPAPIFFPKKHH